MYPFPDTALNFALALAKYPLSADDLEAVRPLRDAVTDWKRFLFWVKRHGISGAALENSTKSGRTLLPGDVHEKLKQLQYQQSIRAMQLQALLADLDQHLKAGGIEFSVIKGIVLSQQLFQSVSLRSSGDLDIVVRLADIPRVEKILLAEMGCSWFHPTRAPTPFQQRIYTRYMYHFVFAEPANDLTIEVHWNLLKPYLISPPVSKKWLQRGSMVDVSGVAVRTLSLEDNFAYLLLHSARHYWESAKCFTDLLALIRHPEMNWEQARATIRENRLEQVMSANLILLQAIYGQPIPAALQGLVVRNKGGNFLVNTGFQALTLPVGALPVLRGVFCELIFKPDWKYKLYSLSSIVLAWVWRNHIHLNPRTAE